MSNALAAKNQYIDKFEAWREGRPITGALLCEYRLKLGEYPAPASANRHIQGLSPWLNQLRIRGEIHVSRDDIRDALRRYKVDKRAPEVMTADEVKRLLGSARKARPQLQRYILLALTIGAREGELMNLKGTDWKHPNIHIFANKTRTERHVPMDFSVTLQTLCKHVENIPYNLLRLTGPRHTVPTYEWREVLERAGLPVKEPRELRRTCRSFVASSGKVPAPALVAWFGHSQLTATQYYENWRGKSEGDTLEEWYGCLPEFIALTRDVVKGLKDCPPAPEPESADSPK